MGKTMLAVPTRGMIGWATVTRLESIRDEARFMDPILYEPGNLSVAQTRNKIVKRFLDSNCTTLCMVDDDIVPPPHLLDLYKYLRDGFGMVGIPHPMPIPNEPNKLALTVFMEGAGGSYNSVYAEDGFHECDAIATGAVLISRLALETLGPNPFRIPDDPFETITSDDFLFCQDLKAHGFKIGYEYRDGWFCDHQTAISLAPLMEASLYDRVS